MGERAVVVGGGAIGIACAHFLVEAGFEVTVVDSGEVGRGCSFANAGLIVPSRPEPLPGPGVVREGLGYLTKRDGPFYIRPRPNAALARWLWRFLRSCGAESRRRGVEALLALGTVSLELYDELERSGGTELSIHRGPVLSAYLSEDWRERAREEAEEHEASGFTARVLVREALLEVEPGVGPRVRGGVLVEDQAWGDCFAFVRALSAGLAGRGLMVLEGAPVRRVVIRGGRAAAVVAGREELPADLVVLAAGAWTPVLAAQLGLRLPIQPAIGYSCTVASYEGAPRIPLMVDERHVVVTPIDGRLRFAGTLELAGFRKSRDQVRYQAVVRAGRDVLPDGVPMEQEEAWHGFRPLTPDDLPVIGWVPGVRGAIVAAGHGTLGFTQSPGTGKVVAQLAAGERPSVPLEPFSPGRFR